MTRAWMLAALVAAGALQGCASVAQPAHLASSAESLCKHCNCLMPAGIDPDAACPVCECGKRAHQCRLGGH